MSEELKQLSRWHEVISHLLSIADVENDELSKEPFHAGGFVTADRIKKFREAASFLASSETKRNEIAAEQAERGLTPEMVEQHYPETQHQPDECEICHFVFKVAAEALKNAVEKTAQIDPAAQKALELDAARYRWLRNHMRWANDTLSELWFDAGNDLDAEIAAEMDVAIDAKLKAGGERPREAPDCMCRQGERCEKWCKRKQAAK